MMTYSPLVGSELPLLQLNPLETDEIQVRCKFVQASLDAEIRFKAPYYTWGNPNDTKPILLNGQQVKVTSNLEACLPQFCDPTEKN